MLAHDLAQHDGARDVVLVVLKRLLHAFAHGLEAGEVDDRVDGLLVEHGRERFSVKDVDLVERHVVSGARWRCACCLGVAHDGAHAVERLHARVGQVIHHDHAVARLQQLHAGVRANEAGAAGHQDGLLIAHDVPFG